MRWLKTYNLYFTYPHFAFKLYCVLRALPRVYVRCTDGGGGDDAGGWATFSSKFTRVAGPVMFRRCFSNGRDNKR